MSTFVWFKAHVETKENTGEPSYHQVTMFPSARYTRFCYQTSWLLVACCWCHVWEQVLDSNNSQDENPVMILWMLTWRYMQIDNNIKHCYISYCFSARFKLSRTHHCDTRSMKLSSVTPFALLVPVAVSATHFKWPAQYTQWENGTRSLIDIAQWSYI